VIASRHFLFKSIVELDLSRQDIDRKKAITLFPPRGAQM
jgi:hypothetical protein